jgi:hypothetical protein
MKFNDAFISVAPLGFTRDITEPLARLSPIPIDFSRRLTPHEPITPEELAALRSLAGSLNYIGQAACPPATYVASAIQQFIVRTNTVAILLQANAMLKELQKLSSGIHFPLADTRDSFRVVALSEDSFAPSSRYGQTGFILKRLFERASFSPDRLHNRPEAARYLLTFVTTCSDRDTHMLSKFS